MVVRLPIVVIYHENDSVVRVHDWAVNLSGRVKQNVAPDPAPDAAQSRPLCASTIERQIAKPMPMPFSLVVTHATVAAWQGDRLTLWSKSQFVVNEKQQIAAVFGLPVKNVQVICPYIGGGFGTTLRTWAHVTLAAVAAREVKRPVKLVLTRRQMFYNTGCRPRTLQRVALGADSEGHLSSIIHEGLARRRATRSSPRH